MDLIWGQSVASTDAWVGRLAGALVAPDTQKATHLIVKRGLLFPTRFVVPLSNLDHYDGEGIYLSLAISDVLKLPKLRRGDLEPNLAAKTADTEIRLADGGRLRLKGLRFTDDEGLLTHFIAASPDLGDLLLPADMAIELSSRYVGLRVGNAALKGLPVYRLDSSIENDLWEALYGSENVPEVDLGGIRASVASGTVTLKGNVRTPFVVKAVERIASAVKGCVSVDNQLASDWEIDLAVASYISREIPGLNNSVVVHTQLGTVHLGGSVPSSEDRDSVTRYVKSIAGIRGMDNLIEVRPAATPVDEGALSQDDSAIEEEPVLEEEPS